MRLMRTGLGLVAALGLGGVPAVAAEVETERMTWVEIRDAVAAGSTRIILPTGGTEQNGPHMVTGKHNFIVKETARRIAEKFGHTLVAPVLAYVPEGDTAKREGHTAYPGTISVPPDVFRMVLESAAISFASHGFKQIVLLGDSGPNQAPQQTLALELSRRWAAEGVSVVHAASYYDAKGSVEFLKAGGETDATIGSHAAIRDTSELMAVYPEGVRLDQREPDKDGVIGDPTRATAERGERLLAFKIDGAIKDIVAASTPPRQDSEPDAKPDGLLHRLWRWVFG